MFIFQNKYVTFYEIHFQTKRKYEIIAKTTILPNARNTHFIHCFFNFHKYKFRKIWV